MNGNLLTYILSTGFEFISFYKHYITGCCFGYGLGREVDLYYISCYKRQLYTKDHQLELIFLTSVIF